MTPPGPRSIVANLLILDKGPYDQYRADREQPRAIVLERADDKSRKRALRQISISSSTSSLSIRIVLNIFRSPFAFSSHNVSIFDRAFKAMPPHRSKGTTRVSLNQHEEARRDDTSFILLVTSSLF